MKPEVWYKLSGKARMDMINGCGARDSWYSFAIPDAIGSVDIYPACAVHDVCYGTGYPKIKSDAMFFYNMVLLITGTTSKCLWLPCVMIALIYYMAVAIFGDHFYHKKTGKKRIKSKGLRSNGRA
jgi:hypothetical protein